MIEAYQPTDLRMRHYFDFFVTEQIYLRAPGSHRPHKHFAGPDQHLSRALSDPALSMRSTATKIRTLDDLAKSVRSNTGTFRHKHDRRGPPLVLDPKQVEAARERIKTRYNVSQEQNLEEQPRANPPRQSNLRMRTHCFNLDLFGAVNRWPRREEGCGHARTGRCHANRRQAEGAVTR